MKKHTRTAMCGAFALAFCTIGTGIASANAEPAATIPSAGSPAELLFWQSVADSRDQAQYEAYLVAFPQGLFAGLARAKIAGLTGAAPKSERSMPAAISDKPAAVAATSPRIVPAAPIEPEGGSLDPAFAEELRTMAMSQGRRHQLGTVVLPARPAMDAIEVFQVPAKFCSGLERNQFHDSRFRPLIDRAGANNARAIAHMELLARLAGEALAKGDNATSNALAQEAASYEPVSKTIYAERSVLDPLFPQLMAVPIEPCAGVK